MLQLMPHDAGLDVAAIACDRQLDDIALSARAVDAALEIMPLSPWFAGKSTRLPGVVLGFAAVREKEIRKAAQLLGRLLRDVKLGR
jgi:DNA-binding transcriptional MocR family regulator